VSWTETLIKKGPVQDEPFAKAGDGAAAAGAAVEPATEEGAGGDTETAPELIPKALLRPPAGATAQSGEGCAAAAGTSNGEGGGAGAGGAETAAEHVELTGVETVAALLVRNRDRWQVQVAEAAASAEKAAGVLV
jgi:hypothetical protein